MDDLKPLSELGQVVNLVAQRKFFGKFSADDFAFRSSDSRNKFVSLVESFDDPIHEKIRKEINTVQRAPHQRFMNSRSRG